jgi:hypothetical protein
MKKLLLLALLPLTACGSGDLPSVLKDCEKVHSSPLGADILKCPIKPKLEEIQSRGKNSMFLTGDYIKEAQNDKDHIYVNTGSRRIGKNCCSVLGKDPVVDGKTMHAIEVCEK